MLLVAWFRSQDILDTSRLQGVENMWTSLGNWTYVFQPYFDEAIPALFGTPQVNALLPFIDPLLSKANLSM